MVLKQESYLRKIRRPQLLQVAVIFFGGEFHEDGKSFD